MHPNKAFRGAGRDENLAFARDRGFGVLTVSGSDGPLASHIPFVLSKDVKSFGAHIVRSNPISPLLNDGPLSALMIVSGPDSYVSPDWYGIDDQVPTWNYVAVHLRGKLRRLPEIHLRSHLEALSSRFETRLKPKPVWTLDKVTPTTMSKLERMIVPVVFDIEHVDGTWKLAQNKPNAARENAAEHVSESGLGQMLDDLSTLMRNAGSVN